jgi:hypothetical protein
MSFISFSSYSSSSYPKICFFFFRMLCNHHSSSSRSIRGGESGKPGRGSIGRWIAFLVEFVMNLQVVQFYFPQEFGCCRVARQSVSSGFASSVRRECAWLDGSGFHGVNLAFLDDTRANRSVDLIQSLAQSTSFFSVFKLLPFLIKEGGGIAGPQMGGGRQI